jgi:hypothetical protein
MHALPVEQINRVAHAAVLRPSVNCSAMPPIHHQLSVALYRRLGPWMDARTHGLMVRQYYADVYGVGSAKREGSCCPQTTTSHCKFFFRRCSLCSRTGCRPHAANLLVGAWHLGGSVHWLLQRDCDFGSLGEGLLSIGQSV